MINKNNKNIVIMVIMLITINISETKINKIVTKKVSFHNSNPEKQAVRIIHKVHYIGRIKKANNNSNIIKMVKLRHDLQY